MLPDENLDFDLFERGPAGMASAIRTRMDELEAYKLTLCEKAEKRRVNQQLHSLRIMLRWCKTRAGYTGSK